MSYRYITWYLDLGMLRFYREVCQRLSSRPLPNSSPLGTCNGPPYEDPTGQSIPFGCFVWEHHRNSP